MKILQHVFAVLYSNYLAQVVHCYSSMSNKQLAALTGFKKVLFEDHGRASILLIGLALKEMKDIYERYESHNMTVSTQRSIRKDALAALKKNKKAYD